MLQLFFFLDAPNGHGVGELLEKGIGCLGAGDEAAGKGLHGDKAHVVFGAQLDQVQIRLGRDMGDGELQRVIQAGLHRLLRHIAPVGGNADEPAFPLLFGLYQGIIGAIFVLQIGHGGDVVQLQDIHIIGAQLL